MDAVALRKESVDRNMGQVMHIHTEIPSLSARRAWIEIKYVVKDSDFSGVALRKESVDRNPLAQVCQCITGSRSPQGERG